MYKKISKSVLSVILAVAMVTPTMAAEVEGIADSATIYEETVISEDSEQAISVEAIAEEEIDESESSKDLIEESVEDVNTVTDEEVAADEEIATEEIDATEAISEDDFAEKPVDEEIVEDDKSTEESISTEDAVVDAIDEVGDEDLAEDGAIISEVEDGEEVFSLSLDIPEEETVPIDSLMADNDELFASYVNKLFGMDDDIAEDGGSYNGDRLTKFNKKVYDGLRSEIEKIANGEREEASITLVTSEIGQKSTYTLADLGVGNPGDLIDTEAKKNAAIDALQTEWAMDRGTIIYAILRDMPYECYWIDYPKSISTSYTGSNTVTISTDKKTITWEPMRTVTFVFRVEKSFSKSGNSNTTLIDTSKVSKPKIAAANASSVVNSYKSLEDYDKLYAYMEYICGEVSYNFDAIGSSWDDDDMSPWQIINVFDKDSSTNVVCEGYAKAFQYLYDMSTFTETGIDCHLVSGTMGGGTGAGPHMWNVVRMKGKNYLVDVTNCDGSSVGAPDKLFMSGTDSLGSTNIGSDVYYFLDDTIYYYYDSDTLNLYPADVLKISTTNYLTHDFSGITNADVNYEWPSEIEYEPESGNTIIVSCVASVECKDCHRKIILDTYNMLIPISVKPTCTENGKTKSGYSEVDPFNTGSKFRLDIPSVVIKATGHDFDEWKIINGDRVRTCKNGCGKQEIEAVKMTPAAYRFIYSIVPVTYDNTAKEVTVSVKNGITGMGSVTVKYVSEGGSPSELSIIAPKNVGSYDVYIDVTEGSNYKAALIKLGTLTINKGTPSYTAPTGLSATCANTYCKDVDLSAYKGFSYMNPNATLSAGSNTVYLKYTDTNTNYAVVENIAVTIVKQDHSYAGKKLKATAERSVPATCGEAGYYVYKVVCDNGCGAQSGEEVNVENSSAPATGNHNIAGSVWDEVGHKIVCASCSHEIKDNDIPIITKATVAATNIAENTAKITVAANDGSSAYASGINKYYLVYRNDSVDSLRATDIAVAANIKTVSSSIISLSGLAANTKYYCALVVSDKAGNLSLKKKFEFTTKAIIPEVDLTKLPKIAGTYGQKISELSITGGKVINPISRTEIAGSWVVDEAESVLNTCLHVNNSETVKLTFNPSNLEYSKVSVDVVPVIEKKDVTVTIADKVRKYNVSNPVLTVESVDGLVNGDAESVLGIVLTTLAKKASGVGEYEITGTADCDDYNVIFNNGKLTVNKTSYTGTKSVALKIFMDEGETATVDMPTLPTGASYGAINMAGNDDAISASVTDGKLTVTSKGIVSSDVITIEVNVVDAKNYNDYVVTVTITPVEIIIYTISFDADGGECLIESLETDKDGKLTEIPNATKEGYDFDGWYIDDVKVTSETIFTGDTTVTAKWLLSHAPVIKWSTDSNYHWHACVVSGCTDKYEKAAHTWNKGTVTKEATATATGTKTYKCTVCSKKKTETIPMKVDKWVETNGKYKWQYADGSYAVNKWVKISGKYYHFDSKGYRQTGWIKDGGKWYYLNANGIMLTGWQKISSKWYYFNTGGDMVVGWKKIDNIWYYFNANGDMAVGWSKIDNKWYYFNTNGDMAIGWKKIDNKWYYFKSGGDMAVGWIKVGGKDYYLYSDGHMAVSTWIGNYHVDANGVWDKTR